MPISPPNTQVAASPILEAEDTLPLPLGPPHRQPAFTDLLPAADDEGDILPDEEWPDQESANAEDEADAGEENSPAVEAEPRMPEPVEPCPDLRGLCDCWNDLVAELMLTRPILGGHLRMARLQPLHETDRGRLVFAERGPFSLVSEDSRHRREIEEFLGSKLHPARPVSLDLEFEASESSAVQQQPSQQVERLSPEDLVETQPILKHIRDLFEGRILTG